ERFDAAFSMARELGLSAAKLGEGHVEPGVSCLVVDRMGALLALYAAADIVFVGGTLAPVGGHTPLEAAAVGRPMILGPHRAHIEALADKLIAAQCVVTVTDEETLSQAWLELDADAERREQMGRAARALVEQERGALERNLQVVEAILAR
ncbi:MAG: 3-deoxy-D-manno-octulosonic acid transferase, partial [Xanthomonadales bacterium]|nr:3-deoxy-D-manno-octulosonic acid transferase [Xanthomonadales bacterium]